MSAFEQALGVIKNNQEAKKSGKDIAIPFGFERLDKVHPGITKKNYTLISSLQKTGKSNFVNYVYVINLINFLYEKTPKTNIQAKVLYFSLEMTQNQLLHQFMCYRLYYKHHIRINVKQLTSLFKGEYVDDNIIKLIEEDKAWFDLLNETVEIVESIKNPYGIFKHVKDYLEKPEIGTYTYRPYDFIDKNGEHCKGQAVDKYVYKNPDLFVFVIVDNYNNFIPEKGTKIYDAIAKFSGDYAITLRNTYSCNIVGIQQQSAETNNNEAHKLGRIEPSVENLKDYKATSNDVDQFITLYSPYRSKQTVYEGYSITKLKDHYRRMSIQLDRNGMAVDTDLYFDGAVNVFKQMPEPSDVVGMEKIVQYISKLKN